LLVRRSIAQGGAAGSLASVIASSRSFERSRTAAKCNRNPHFGPMADRCSNRAALIRARRQRMSTSRCCWPATARLNVAHCRGAHGRRARGKPELVCLELEELSPTMRRRSWTRWRAVASLTQLSEWTELGSELAPARPIRSPRHGRADGEPRTRGPPSPLTPQAHAAVTFVSRYRECRSRSEASSPWSGNLADRLRPWRRLRRTRGTADAHVGVATSANLRRASRSRRSPLGRAGVCLRGELAWKARAADSRGERARSQKSR